MRIADFDHVTPAFDDLILPGRLEQTGSPRSTAVVIGLLLPLLLGIFGSFAALMARLAADPQTRDLVASHPAAALQVTLAITLIAVLLGWPLRTLIDRLGRRRTVEIGDTQVTVTDHGLWRQRTWQRALGEYRGVAHHIRTTHAGPRHELILVHSDRRANVLIALASRLTDRDLARAALLVGLPVVPALALYGTGAHTPTQAVPTAPRDLGFEATAG